MILCITASHQHSNFSLFIILKSEANYFTVQICNLYIFLGGYLALMGLAQRPDIFKVLVILNYLPLLNDTIYHLKQ